MKIKLSLVFIFLLILGCTPSQDVTVVDGAYRVPVKFSSQNVTVNGVNAQISIYEHVEKKAYVEVIVPNQKVKLNGKIFQLTYDETIAEFEGKNYVVPNNIHIESIDADGALRYIEDIPNIPYFDGAGGSPRNITLTFE